MGIREVPNGTLGTDDAVGRAVLRNGPGVQVMRQATVEDGSAAGGGVWVEPNMEGRVLQGHGWKGGGGEGWRLTAANHDTAHMEEVLRKGSIGQRVAGDEEMVVMENSGDEKVG